MNQTFNTAYPVRFWLTGVFWASIFMMVIFLTEVDDFVSVQGTFRAWVALALLAAAFSLPTFILVHFLFFGMLSKEMSAFKRKFILTALAIIGMLITFFIISLIEGVSFSEFGIELFIPICYIVGFLISSFLCDIQKSPK